MHHAHRDDGAGWCLYDDWVLALRMLRRASGGKVQRAMLIDLDVHQVGWRGLSCKVFMPSVAPPVLLLLCADDRVCCCLRHAASLTCAPCSRPESAMQE